MNNRVPVGLHFVFRSPFSSLKSLPYSLGRVFLFIVFFLPLTTYHLPLSFAVEVSPVLNVRLLAGQYFFEEQESNLTGNIGVIAAPAIAFNPSWTLIPTLSSSWRGTKSVQDLVGGGTLFQQSQDHSINVKGIYSPRKIWLFKAGGGYHVKLLKETADEDWGKGLFDYQKPSANIEVERLIGEESGVRLGYDFYWLNFKNYSSLESQRRDLGRENVGDKVLNTNNHGFYAAYRTPFPFFGGQKARFDMTYFFTFRNYTQATVVLLTGDLSSEKRKDKSHILTTNLNMPFVFSETFKLLTELRVNFSKMTSNQNNFDARTTSFHPNYYAYTDYSISPNFNFILGKRPWILTSGFTYVRRNYDDRPVQDGNGTFGTDKSHLNEYYVNFGLTYPITRKFRFQAITNFGWSRSNIKFEKTYRYNYRTFTYLLGLIFDY